MAAIRKILPAEAALVRDHLVRLDPHSRRLRFGAAVHDRYVERFVDGLDWMRSINLGYFVGDALRGSAHLIWHDGAWPPGVEFAVAVEAEHQDKGVGTDLTRRAVTIARNRGINTLYMVCLRENARMQHLARKVGAKLIFEGSEVEAEVALPTADHLSIMQEAIDDGAGLLAEVLERVPTPMTVLRLPQDDEAGS